jgi:hypothetical protein
MKPFVCSLYLRYENKWPANGLVGSENAGKKACTHAAWWLAICSRLLCRPAAASLCCIMNMLMLHSSYFIYGSLVFIYFLFIPFHHAQIEYLSDLQFSGRSMNIAVFWGVMHHCLVNTYVYMTMPPPMVSPPCRGGGVWALLRPWELCWR